MRAPRVSRRGFLRAGAASGVALVVGFNWSLEAGAQEKQEKKRPSPFDAWIRIAKDGTVTLLLAKSEMGQGVITSLPMILADDLEVDWSRVKVEQAPTRPEIYSHGTGGSGSVRSLYLPLRQAAAAAREMLILAAARRFDVNPSACRAEKGYVLTGPRDKRLAYAELVGEAASLPLPDFNTVPLKSPTDFSIIGTATPRVDIPSKVTGAAVFGIDVRAPGMV